MIDHQLAKQMQSGQRSTTFAALYRGVALLPCIELNCIKRSGRGLNYV